MKKSLLLKLCASVVAVASLTAATSAKGFTKTNEYQDGKFADVPSNQWYAAEVKSAYELGFINGKSDTAFDPNGNVTVAEGIKMASCVHAIYNGKTIAEVKGGKWYDMYISYAKENGLISDGQFTNFDRNIMRYEMAVMFANAMPKEYFGAKNDIKDIPDVAKTEEYYDDLMMLYKAGVVLGSDDYGNFYAINPIKRSEAAAIINRVALPEKRKEGTLKEYGNRNPAVYLIESEGMTRTINDITSVQSGWKHENIANDVVVGYDFSTGNLNDTSTEYGTYLRKDVYTVDTGKVKLEAAFTVSGAGGHVIFEAMNGDVLFELVNDSSKIYAVGDEKKEISPVTFTSGKQRLVVSLDMDTREAKIYINSIDCGTYKMSTKAKDLSMLVFATGESEKLSLSPTEVIMYWNYNVNDSFRMQDEGEKLLDWTTTGDAKVVLVANDSDKLTPRIKGEGSAKRSFDALDGTFVYETYIRAPKGQKGTLTLKNGDKDVMKFDIADGKILADGTLARKYTEGVWQQIRVEADTDKNTAIIKVNGKKCLNVAFDADKVDGVEITSSGSADLWFDDVVGYRTYEYPDYCPVPVPVNDDEWYSGMSICSLWRDGSHFGWDFISPYSEIEPVIGYYDEGIPEVADWEIKFMAEHGYDYQRFCWYLGTHTDFMKKPRLVDDALHDGYFNAKYSDMLDFSIVWENGAKGTKYLFYNQIWPYWVDWYLTDDRYFCIDNKPVLAIHVYDYFREIMGGKEGVKEAVKFMNDEVKKLGYDGIIISISDSGANKALNEELKYVGIETKAAYHFGESAYDVDFQKNKMELAHDAGSVFFTPSAGIGFNDIGWTETRTPLASADDFQNLLEWIRDEYLPSYKDDPFVKPWMLKSVFTNTWNEFGEGHYVFPTVGLNKFGYLDAHRNVFSSVAGKDDKAHFDVVPTDNQRDRLGYLYPARTNPMRRLYSSGGDGNDYDSFDKVISWDFENPEDCKKWAALARVTGPVYDEKEKALVGTTTGVDGHIKLVARDDNFFDASKAKYLHVVMKLDKSTNQDSTIFFNADTNNSFTGVKSFSFSSVADGEYHDYYVELGGNIYWTDIIKNLRFDPFEGVGNFYIKRIEFLGGKSAASETFNVDGKPIPFDKKTLVITENEIYAAANPSNGFYNIHGMYYEYNRWNGTLMIKANNGTVFNFTVGSDKALVNGKEEKLIKPIELYDGLVVLPIKFIYDKAGYKYRIEDGCVVTEIRSEGIKEAIAARVENEFEFNVAGDTEGWGFTAADGNVTGGMAVFDAVHTGVRYDPQLYNFKLRIDATLYDKVEIRVKPVYEEQQSDATLVMFFGTTSAPGFAGQRAYRQDMSKLTPDAEGFYTITFDTTTHPDWKGTVTCARFDPGDSAGHFEIDYIRFKKNEKLAAEMAEKIAKEEAERLAIEAIVDAGGPFYIKNFDAEQDVDISDFGRGANKVSIVEDDLRPGNKAIKVTTDEKVSKVWAYINIPTRFKPGVTYKVDFEYRIIGDNLGNEADRVPFNVNFRYADLKADGTFSEMADHPVMPTTSIGGNGASTSDGWIKCSVTHTISTNSTLRINDLFCLYTDPIEKDGVVHNYTYLMDNIVVSVVK